MEMCKTLLGFAHFHRHGGDELKTTTPDRSLATKTGHFYLLPTIRYVHYDTCIGDQDSKIPATDSGKCRKEWFLRYNEFLCARSSAG